mgnify:CR=1 FL=1
MPRLKRSEAIDNRQGEACSYQILDTKVMGSRTYALVKFTFPDVGAKKRTEMLEKIVRETGSIALIEWWSKGSIIYKPRENFYGILVFRSSSMIRST